MSKAESSKMQAQRVFAHRRMTERLRDSTTERLRKDCRILPTNLHEFKCQEFIDPDELTEGSWGRHD